MTMVKLAHLLPFLLSSASAFLPFHLRNTVAPGFGLTTTTTTIPITYSALPTTFPSSRVTTNPFTTTTTTTCINLFGGMFGGGDSTNSNNTQEAESLETQLAIFPKLAMKDDLAFTSLSEFLHDWSKLFETDKSMKLTTPVQILMLASSDESSTTTTADDVNKKDDDNNKVVARSGLQFVFKNTNTGYMNRKEEAAVGGGYRKPSSSSTSTTETTPSQPKSDKKDGGVEILVEQLATSGEVRVRARRCNVDENTMIKEMSEEKIISELKKALEVWKKGATA
jgi:hypothetical protein